MGVRTWPAYVGIVGGIVVFVVLLVPILLFQVRRYGALDARRILGAGAVSVYGVALVAYTLLPLPQGDLTAWCAAHGHSSAQLNPFQLVDDLRTAFARNHFPSGLRDPLVLQLVFNVLLFVPWGVIARRYLGWRLLPTVVGAFAISLAIETTQYTGIWGLIGCSYRVADVDDLLTNTLGGFLGALLAPRVLGWMPSSADLGARRLDARPVTVWRRWLGMGFDGVLLVGLGFVLDLFYRLSLAFWDLDDPSAQDAWDWVLSGVVPFVVVCVVPPLVGTGASWGQRLVWLAPHWPARVTRGRDGESGDRHDADGDVPRRGTASRRLLRAAVPGGLWGLLVVLVSLPASTPDAWRDGSRVLAVVVGVIAVAAVPFTRGRRGLSGVVSGAEIRDVRAG